MQGLRQIQVITQGDGWHLVGLDAEGQVWFGSPRRTSKGRALAWVLMDESLEDEATASAQAPEDGAVRRPWPAKPGS
ncbi:MAG TPA: hypothetical protein VIE41_16940 [Methylomirabilota bacterium]|jgi:hypothetical protein